MRSRWIWVTVAMFVMTIEMPVQAETVGAPVSLQHGVRFSAPDGSLVALSAGTYRLEAAGDDQLRLLADGLAEPHVLKAVPLSFDIRIDKPTALFIPDEPNVSQLVLALPGGKGYDARTWTSEIRSRTVTDEGISREKVNAALAALLQSSSPAESAGLETAEATAEPSAAGETPGGDVESRGGLPFLQRPLRPGVQQGFSGSGQPQPIPKPGTLPPDPSLIPVLPSGMPPLFSNPMPQPQPTAAPGQNWAADVGVTMRDTSNPAQQEVSYEMTILNHGKDVAQDVRLVLALREPGPPGVRVTSVPSRKICLAVDISPGNPVVTCTVPTLAVGQSITVNVVLANPGNGPRYSIAQVMSVTPDPNPSNNWATNIGHGVAATANAWVADLAVALTGMADPPNQLQTYQLGLTNQGDDDARDISLTFTFSNAVPGTSVVRIDPRGAACTSREAAPGLPVITCTVPQLGVRATVGATIVLSNPGNGPRTSTAQAMSIVPDMNRANNSVTITVPQGSAPPTAQATTPPPAIGSATPSTPVPLPPSGMVLSPAPPAILGITPMILQPKVTAPVQQATPPPAPIHFGKYRVVINGLRVIHETRDDMWQRDGKRDEVYVAAFVRVVSRSTGQLLDHGFVKSMVHGDVNNIGNRIQAGTASDLGGIRTGDIVPGPRDPALPTSRPASTTTFPVYVWEGTLDDDRVLVIHPTLWEWDGGIGNYNQWIATMHDMYLVQGRGGYLENDRLLVEIPLRVGSSTPIAIDNVPGHDHPIGLGSAYRNYNDAMSVLTVEHPVIILTRARIEALFSSPSVIGGVPPVVIPVVFVDYVDGLEGNYTMYLRVEKLQ